MTKGNLLIVDDEEMLVRMLKDTLHSYADQVFTAPDGLIALDVVKKNKVHCIICDINMPNMNGVEVLKKLRDMKNDVPFIFFTGHGNHSLMIEAAKYGAFDFLDKPFYEGLEDVVKRGLVVGVTGSDEPLNADAVMSDYQKLLKSLDE